VQEQAAVHVGHAVLQQDQGVQSGDVGFVQLLDPVVQGPHPGPGDACGDHGDDRDDRDRHNDFRAYPEVVELAPRLSRRTELVHHVPQPTATPPIRADSPA
jgi:hypothetical protein